LKLLLARLAELRPRQSGAPNIIGKDAGDPDSVVVPLVEVTRLVDFRPLKQVLDREVWRDASMALLAEGRVHSHGVNPEAHCPDLRVNRVE